MKRQILSVFLVGGMLFLCTSCYDVGSVNYDELDVTITQYDTKFDFQTYSTFAIPDSTILKTNYLEAEDISEFYAPGGASDRIRAGVREKFLTLGYTEATTADANFVAVPTVLLVRTTGAVYYPPGWWWGYPGWGWGYPGWGYPGYPWNPGYVSYYSYKEGSLVIEMIDGGSFRNVVTWLGNNPQTPENADEIPEFNMRWMATIDGYLSSNAEYDENRATRGLNEAFEQSPYLEKK